MHYLALAFKRAHLRSLALARPTVERLGLTPARFEICHYILGFGGAPRQFQIRRALGVSAVTISRMVRRMAELGLVVRTRIGRRAFVGLSEEGRKRVENVVKRVLAPFAFSESYETSWGKRDRYTLNLARMIYRYVIAVIRNLGGRATHWFPRPPHRRGEVPYDDD
jgi:DNA-binding MarR family transcriptional regulator